jgi:hypothetical protein
LPRPGAEQQREPGYHWGWHDLLKTNRQEQKETRQKETYNNYKLKKEKMNLERVKNGLEPRPIATFEEWKQVCGKK